METPLRCSQTLSWGGKCMQPAVSVDEKQQDLRNLYCKRHAGANKRRKYGERPLIDITGDVKDALVTMQREEAVAAAKRREEKQQAEHERLAGIAPFRWKENDQQHVLVKPDRYDENDKTVWKILAVEEGVLARYGTEVTVAKPSRPFDDVVFPTNIDTRNSSALTPTEARLLAAALLEAADLAEGLNEAARPKE